MMHFISFLTTAICCIRPVLGTLDTTSASQDSITIATGPGLTYVIPALTGSYSSFIATASNIPAFVRCRALYTSGFSYEYWMATDGGFHGPAASYLATQMEDNTAFDDGIAAEVSNTLYDADIQTVYDAVGAARLWTALATVIGDAAQQTAVESVASQVLYLQTAASTAASTSSNTHTSSPAPSASQGSAVLTHSLSSSEWMLTALLGGVLGVLVTL